MRGRRLTPGRASASVIPNETLPRLLKQQLEEHEVATVPERGQQGPPPLRSLTREIARGEELPEPAEWLEVEGEETLPCFRFPSTHRPRIRTTNRTEGLNQEFERRSWGVRTVPNPKDCRRLAAVRLEGS